MGSKVLSDPMFRSESSNGVITIRKSIKNILMRTLDDGFGEDLMCENFGQRGLRTVYWRTPCLAVWRPMRSQRRVLRTTFTMITWAGGADEPGKDESAFGRGS